MGIDTNQIKTNENLRCTYKLLLNDNDNEILAVSPLICDYFKARYEGANTNAQNTLGIGFVFATTTITISTTDDVNILHNSYSKGIACEVHIINENTDYIVKDVQFKKSIKNCEFINKPEGRTYISLRLKEKE
jgi:hypothetical protein